VGHLFTAETACDSTFNLTETNLFKQLTHLSLRFRAGNDTAVKNFLAGRLSSLKATVAELQTSYSTVRARESAGGAGG